MDFSRALDLEPTHLCRELNRYDCVSFVHPISLGGVAAYEAGIYEPLAQTAITAPMVADRLALATCANRLAADLANPAQGLIWRIAPPDGRIDPTADEPVASVRRLYERILLRHPTPAEIAHHQQLYRDIDASGESALPAADWAVLSCFVVLSSVESLFY
jgi:hypothetical protein